MRTIGSRTVRTGALHESLRPHDAPAGASDRGFGLVFAAAGAALGLLSLWRSGWRLTGTGAAEFAAGACFLLLALAAPAVLAPLNRAWTAFGRALNAVTSPVVMAVLFYGVVAPVGALMRLSGKDPLRLRRDPAAETYWIERPRRGYEPGSMIRQF